MEGESLGEWLTGLQREFISRMTELEEHQGDAEDPSEMQTVQEDVSDVFDGDQGMVGHWDGDDEQEVGNGMYCSTTIYLLTRSP